MQPLSKLFAAITARAEFLAFAAATSTQALGALIAGVACYRWLEPADMGIWALLQSYQVWMDLFKLGIPSGLTRQIAYHLGLGAASGAAETVSTAEGATRATLAFGTVVFALIALPMSTRGTNWKWGIGAAAVAWVASTYAAYVQASCRSSPDFRQLSRVLVMDAAVGFILLALVPYFGFVGFCLRSAIQPIILVAALHRIRPFSSQVDFHLERFGELLKIGLPLFGGGYLLQLAGNAERLMLGWYDISPSVVGLLSPAQSVQSAMLLLPSTVLTYAYPKLSFQHARSESITKLWRKSLLASALSIGFCVCLSIPLWFLIPTFVPALFPKFGDSVLSMQLALIAAPFLAIRPTTALLPVLKAWWAYYLWVVVLVASKFALCFVLIPRLEPLLAVSLANVAACALTFLAILIGSFYACERAAARIADESCVKFKAPQEQG